MANQNKLLVASIVATALSASLLILLLPPLIWGDTVVSPWLLWGLMGVLVGSATGMTMLRLRRKGPDHPAARRP